MSEAAVAPGMPVTDAPSGATEDGDAAEYSEAADDAALEAAAATWAAAQPAPAAPAAGTTAPAAAPAAPGTPPADPGKPADTPPPAAPDAAAAAEAARIQELIDRQLAGHQAREADKGRMAQLEAQVAELTGKLSKLKDNPLDVLEGEGWDAEALAAAMVGKGTPQSVQMRQAMTLIKKQGEELTALKQQEEAKAQAAEAARNVATFKASHIAEPLKAATAKYPYLLAEAEANGHDPVEVIYGHLNNHFRERNGQVLPMQAVADVLEAQARKRFEVIRDKANAPAAAAASTAPSQTTPKPATTTLNNGLSQSKPSLPELTPDDDYSDDAMNRRVLEYARSQGIG